MAIYKHRFAIDIYALALAGASDKFIAKQLGVSPTGLSGWKRRHASVRYAFSKARKERIANENTDWTGYIRGRLSPKMLRIWDKITMFDHDASGYSRVEAMLEGRGKKMRQQLLIYAFLQSGFNISKALRKVAIPKSTFEKWKENDPEFIELLDEVHLAKKDFFEEALIRLVRSGDSPATIVANKSINKDRGYGESTKVEITGNIGFLPIPIHELDLPLEVQRIILEACHNRERVKSLPPGESIVELPKKHVESVEVSKQ